MQCHERRTDARKHSVRRNEAQRVQVQFHYSVHLESWTVALDFEPGQQNRAKETKGNRRKPERNQKETRKKQKETDGKQRETG